MQKLELVQLLVYKIDCMLHLMRQSKNARTMYELLDNTNNDLQVCNPPGGDKNSVGIR